MALSIDEAKKLQPGTLLSFQDKHLYEVLSVSPHGKNGVYLALKREDGFETYALQYGLHKAEIVRDAHSLPPATEHGSEADALDIALENMAADSSIQAEIADVAESALPDDKADDTSAPSTNRKGKGNRS